MGVVLNFITIILTVGVLKRNDLVKCKSRWVKVPAAQDAADVTTPGATLPCPQRVTAHLHPSYTITTFYVSIRFLLKKNTIATRECVIILIRKTAQAVIN